MAKAHIDRLKKKYGDNVTGKKYKDLMNEIVYENTKGLTGKLANMNRDEWNSALKKVTPKDKKFILPETGKIIPPSKILANKSVESGKLITNALKGRLNKDMRETLNSFTTKTGEQNIVIRRGKTAGQINTKLIDEFESKIRNTFTNYTKKHPKFNAPSNVRDIAVTEMNSMVNNIKKTYMEEAVIANPELKVKKQWMHHPGRSKKDPRKGHAIVGGQKPKPFDAPYHVPLYQKVKGRLVRTGFDLMQFPHEPGSPLEQVINCHCEIIYLTKWSKQHVE